MSDINELAGCYPVTDAIDGHQQTQIMDQVVAMSGTTDKQQRQQQQQEHKKTVTTCAAACLLRWCRCISSHRQQQTNTRLFAVLSWFQQ